MRSRTSRAGSSACSGSGISPTKSSEGVHGPCLLFRDERRQGDRDLRRERRPWQDDLQRGPEPLHGLEAKTECPLFLDGPQASLSDIFDRDIFGKGLVPVIPNLDVVEIDADRRGADYQGEVKQKILTMYGLSELPAEIEEYIDSTSAEPPMYESPPTDPLAHPVA